MKTIFRLLCIPGMIMLMMFPGSAQAEDQKPAENQVIVSCCPELEEVTSLWVNNYSQTHPDVQLIMKPVKEGVSERQAGIIIFSTGKGLNTGENIRKITLGREVIVPVINKNNPYLAELQKTGLSSGDLAALYTTGKNMAWESFVNKQGSTPVVCCLPSDNSCESYLSSFLNTDTDKIFCLHKGSNIQTLSYVAGNKNAITFCRLTDLNNWHNGERENLVYLPVDNNGNNRIDPFESIYSNTEDLVRGIWIGKYPKQLYNRVYALLDENVNNPQELAFLEWILNDGQEYLVENGFLDLSFHEVQSERNKLKASIVPLAEVDSGSTNLPVILITGLIILAGIILLIFMMGIFGRSTVEEDIYPGEYPGSPFTENKVRIPGGLFYDRSHTWTFMEKDGSVKTGVDDFLPHVTGKITRVKMRKPGENINKGEVFLSIVRNGKQLDIKSPISGIIKETNPKVKSNSEVINRDPFEDGWVYRIEASEWENEMKMYLMAPKYREWLKAEFARLKEVLVKILDKGKDVNLKPVLQEGGEIRDFSLEDLSPAAWEDFQNQFINKAR